MWLLSPIQAGAIISWWKRIIPSSGNNFSKNLQNEPWDNHQLNLNLTKTT
jgi:hypothetical protein